MEQTQEIEEEEEEVEEVPEYGTEEWYAWLQSQADPIHSQLYY